jgi:dihydrofolate reductase
MRFNLIVAMCRNNGIGYNGQLPWQLPQDLQYFSLVTKGEGLNAVIMGHTTWQSLPTFKEKPRGLPERDNFVLSHNSSFDMLINHQRLIKTFQSIAELESYIDQNNTYEEVWVIGGASIYKQFLDLKKIDRCYVTYIDKDFVCDSFFPLDFRQALGWKEIKRNETYDTKYACNVNYLVYDVV